MYMLENEGQPDVFTSIPVAMWWAIETLTTVGYGDIVPTTAAGRVDRRCVSIIGIGTLALFSGLITVGFLDQLKMYRDQHPRVRSVVAETKVTIRRTYRDGDGAAMTDVAALQRGDGLHSLSGLPNTCPHCGSAMVYSAIAEEAATSRSAPDGEPTIPRRAAERVYSHLTAAKMPESGS